MSFELVRQLQQKAGSVDRMCRVLEVSRSGYYAARKRSLAQPEVCEASVQLKAAFAARGGAYGSRRLRTAVASRGVEMGIYRLRLAPFDAPAWSALGVEAKVRAHDR